MAATAQRPIMARYLALGGADLTAKALGFTVTMVTVRTFGAEGLGQLGVAAALVAYGALFTTCGTDVFGVRAVASHPSRAHAVARAIRRARLGLAGFAYLALILVAAAIPRLRSVLPYVAIHGLLVFVTALSLVWAAQGLERTRILALANVGIQGLALSFVLAFVALGAGLGAIPLGQVLGEGGIAILLMLWLHRHATRGDDSPLQVAGILRASAPMAGSQLLRALALGSDVLILALVMPMDDVGRYAGAYRVFTLALSLSATYFVILLPRLCSIAAHGDGSAVRREMTASLGRVSLIAVPLLAVLAGVSGPLLGLLFGDGFRSAAPALAILAAAVLSSLLAGHFRNTLLAIGRPVRDLGAVAAATAVHLTVKLLLAPLLGGVGVALGTLAGETTLLLVGALAVSGLLRPPLSIAHSRTEAGGAR